MNMDIISECKHNKIYFFTGIITGLILLLISDRFYNFPFLFHWVIIASPLFLLSYSKLFSLFQSITLTLIFSALIACLLYFKSTSTVLLEPIVLMSSCVLLVFFISFNKYGFKLTYESLFYSGWETAVKVCFCILFVTLVYFFLILFSFLFALTGFEIFYEFFVNPFVVVFLLPVIFSVGLLVTNYIKDQLSSFLSWVLVIFYLLLPVASIFSILFIVTIIIEFIFQTITPMYFPTIMMLLVAGFIFIINAVFKYGEEAAPYPNAILIIVNIAIVLLPIYSILGGFSLLNANSGLVTFHGYYFAINSDFYGQTVAIFYLTFLFLQSTCYSYYVFIRREKWLEGIKNINIIFALFILLIGLVNAAYHLIGSIT